MKSVKALHSWLLVDESKHRQTTFNIAVPKDNNKLKTYIKCHTLNKD